MRLTATQSKKSKRLSVSEIRGRLDSPLCRECGTCCHLISHLPLLDGEEIIFEEKGKGEWIKGKKMVWKDGGCKMAGKNGCEIYEDRPHACRTFPFVEIELPENSIIVVMPWCQKIMPLEMQGLKTIPLEAIFKSELRASLAYLAMEIVRQGRIPLFFPDKDYPARKGGNSIIIAGSGILEESK
ncbi:YkgJ family cysteine cluster protein [Candidatus Micrarchaeota archaeon]|nr:YkgJ family cysteine cluster protein [Candidatus Micrarchaeota archaeon]